MKAITREENQVVEMLLADPRINVNLCSQAAGLTPLHIACATGHQGFEEIARNYFQPIKGQAGVIRVGSMR